MTQTSPDETAAEFRKVVNMTPAELERWLKTEQSREVGWADGHQKTGAGGPESVGHHSGRRIVEIAHKKKAEIDDDDLAHMRKVIGYVHRHLAQRPAGDVTDTRWHHSLMNWGHDPLKT
jgi:hypothetical protein